MINTQWILFTWIATGVTCMLIWFHLAESNNEFCFFTHRIESIVNDRQVLNGAQYLVMFDQFMLEYYSAHKFVMHTNNSIVDRTRKLCGYFRIPSNKEECHLKLSYNNNDNNCDQVFVYVFFDQLDRQYKFYIHQSKEAIISIFMKDKLEFANMSAGFEMLNHLSLRLSMLKSSQCAPFAYDPFRNTFHVVDNDKNKLYIWNAFTEKLHVNELFKNKFSTLFYSFQDDRIYGLLYNFDTIFVQQNDEFFPTSITMKKILECEFNVKSQGTTTSFILCLICIASLIGFILTIVVLFLTFEELYTSDN